MADEAIINSGGRTVENSGNDDREEEFVDFNNDGNGTEQSGLVQKIETLEQEKQNLSQQNESMRHEIEKLKAEEKALNTEKVELTRCIDASEADKKTLQFISIRAAELETGVSRLQHDLASSMEEGEEANKELIQLKKALDEMKKIESEKNSKLEDLDKERNLLIERINKDDEGVKETKAHTEARIKEMEKKIDALEHIEDSVKSERITIEEETKAKMDEKDSKIRRLKSQLEDLDSVGVKNDLELERLKKENEELEIVKNELEAHLKKSERKVKEIEQMVNKLNKELEASESIIIELKEKKVHDDVNGKVVIVSKDDPEIGWNGLSNLKLQWPIVAAASTGATVVAALAAVCYLRYARQS